MYVCVCVCVFVSVCVYSFNHELVFGVSVKNLSKTERLIFGDSLMTHAMILTAVTDKVCTHTHTPHLLCLNSHAPSYCKLC